MVLQKLKLSVLHAVVLAWKPALLGSSSASLLRPGKAFALCLFFPTLTIHLPTSALLPSARGQGSNRGRALEEEKLGLKSQPSPTQPSFSV